LKKTFTVLGDYESFHQSLKDDYNKTQYDLLLNKALKNIFMSKKYGYELDVLFSCIDLYEVDMFTLISLITENFEKKKEIIKENGTEKKIEKKTEKKSGKNVNNNTKEKKKSDEDKKKDLGKYKNRSFDALEKKDTSKILDSNIDFLSRGD
jgi:hypothetical protein